MHYLDRIEAEGRSGRLWVFVRNSTYKFNVIKANFNYIHLSICGGEFTEMMCTTVYVYPQTTHKRQCFDNIKELARNMKKPWCIIGDFNEILSEEEKK